MFLFFCSILSFNLEIIFIWCDVLIDTKVGGSFCGLLLWGHFLYPSRDFHLI